MKFVLEKFHLLVPNKNINLESLLMRKKESLCIDYLITPSMGIFVIDGQQINLVSSDGTKKFAAISKKQVKS